MLVPKRLLRDPLLHFALAGALLFGAHGWLRGGDEEPGSPAIRLTAQEVDWLRQSWARQFQREPDEEQTRELVTEFLEEELLAREARALGLEDGDTIVRRRLAQKMAFLIEDTANLVEPSDEDLRRFHAATPERFRADARLSFVHVYFDGDRREDAGADASEALGRLRRGETPPEELGDRLLLESSFEDADESVVAAAFGADFARAVLALEPDAWAGPIPSGYGLHLVRVSHVTPGRTYTFEEVRDEVRERWRAERQREIDGRTFAALLDKYDVLVDESVKPLVGPLDRPLAAPEQTGEDLVR